LFRPPTNAIGCESLQSCDLIANGLGKGAHAERVEPRGDQVAFRVLQLVFKPLNADEPKVANVAFAGWAPRRIWLRRSAVALGSGFHLFHGRTPPPPTPLELGRGYWRKMAEALIAP
jgi:hypothetical protein